MIQEISQIINSAQNSEEAALKIIEYLEKEGLSLEANGWLDDDPLWQIQEENISKQD